MKIRTLMILAGAAISMLALGCAAAPPTQSEIRIGDSSALLPKNDQFGTARFEIIDVVNGQRRTLELTNVRADPQAALTAFAQTQTANLDVLRAAVDKIAVPGITTVNPATPAPVVVVAAPATAPAVVTTPPPTVAPGGIR